MKNNTWLIYAGVVFALAIACGDDSGRETDSSGASDSVASQATSDGSGPGTSTTGDTSGVVTTGGGSEGESDSDSDGSSSSETATTGEPGPNLEVDPVAATILVLNGLSQSEDYEALLDGVPVTASWTLADGELATINDDGKVFGTGQKGGVTTVTAFHEGLSADASLQVDLQVVVDGGGVTPEDKGLLQGAIEPDPETTWAYPYDEMVYPQDLRAPEFMWNGGGAGDKYLIHITADYLDIQIFANADPPSRYLLDQETWDTITKTVAGESLDLKVTRLKPGEAFATVVVDHTYNISNAKLDGSVYYWANSLGRVLRINPGADAPEDFLAANGQNGCSTCHSVSADGNTMIIGGDIAVSTWDLSNNVQILGLADVGKAVRNWAMPAISPDGTVLIENAAPLPGPPGGSDGMWNAMTGVKLENTGLEGVQLNMPAFGPAGDLIAYITHDTLALATYDFDANATFASNPTVLVEAGPDPMWNGITFPSVSPNSGWIVYHRGQYPNSLDTRLSRADLFLANANQPGVEIRLSAVNGDVYPFAAGDRDLSYNYEPTFAPISSGGYSWVVFTSRRTYGNRLTGASNAVKQLWVFAIDQNPDGNSDPSHPAFWLPGQDLGTLNMRGFWALEADIPG